ncbi:hypothetical protein D3C85_1242860 [compost metagenome]
MRDHFAIGGARQLLSLQAVAHTITLRAKLPGQTPEGILRGLIKFVIFRPRQGANAVAPQQLFDALCFSEFALALAERQAVAVFQQSPFKSTHASFEIGAERIHHFRHINPTADRQIATHTAQGTIKRQALSGFYLQTPAGPDRRTVKRRVTARARQGKPAVAFKLNAALSEGDFQRCGIRIVTHQQVGNLQRGFIQRAAIADSGLSQTHSSTILHRGI